MAFFLYILFFFFAILLSNSYKRKAVLYVLFITCCVFSIWAGNRDIMSWADTGGYVMAFQDLTPTISDFFTTKQIGLYSERGFFFLSSVIKTFTDSYVTYFLIIALLGFYFIGNGLKKYSIFPLIGLCVYISRFVFGRHFIQIRSGLAIAVLFWGLQYFTKKDWKRCAILIAVATLLHRSALLAIPVFLMGYLKIKKKHIVWGLVISLILAGFFPDFILQYVQDAGEDINISSYTDISDTYGKNRKGLGLANPMVYYQMAILLAFTFAEKRLRRLTPHYDTLRNGYFFSTVLLIVLGIFRVLSGRTSTVFATYEILMVPLLVYLFNRKNRMIGYIGLAAIYSTIFYLNFK